ncbi:protein obstructor-E isoform X4 [Nilaparvata lugens]|uniref:Cuticular protein n=1 Tax=Nilaparvata lugens TaxID=108931 RepID=A0A2S1ZS47_NILLU|nr:protein obstructor-E isoform X3 [Nilaparvata lugens]XP_039289062.1 protein obstructor-E isoform X4 [Nilaparvata lugens]AWK28282.1 cuticular protein [Nilaparvata lugens]
MSSTLSPVPAAAPAFLLLLALVNSFAGAADFQCPSAKFGQYEDPVQCDKFYECDEGRATPKLCPDGLVFDPLNRKVNKCDQPFNVDCGDRIELQAPKSNHLCPRKNGYFAHPDAAVCNVFYNCIEGEATEITCPSGLHFDEYTGTCVWPDSAGRSGCGEADTMKLKDGFSCPKDAQASPHGQTVAHPVYAHPQDCQKFYVCLNGVTPREQGCAVGEVYNEETQKCDSPENVPGCEDYYKNDPRFKELYTDSDGDGKIDFGKKRVFHS